MEIQPEVVQQFIQDIWNTLSSVWSLSSDPQIISYKHDYDWSEMGNEDAPQPFSCALLWKAAHNQVIISTRIVIHLGRGFLVLAQSAVVVKDISQITEFLVFPVNTLSCSSLWNNMVSSIKQWAGESTVRVMVQSAFLSLIDEQLCHTDREVWQSSGHNWVLVLGGSQAVVQGSTPSCVIEYKCSTVPGSIRLVKSGGTECTAILAVTKIWDGRRIIRIFRTIYNCVVMQTGKEYQLDLSSKYGKSPFG